MEADSTPKIDLMVEGRSVGHLGLATLAEAHENTDYSDSEDEDEANVISEGADATSDKTATKRTSARIQLSEHAGNLHKRTRQA